VESIDYVQYSTADALCSIASQSHATHNRKLLRIFCDPDFQNGGETVILFCQAFAAMRFKKPGEINDFQRRIRRNPCPVYV
jgi:hypothetical protein